MQNIQNVSCEFIANHKASQEDRANGLNDKEEVGSQVRSLGAVPKLGLIVGLPVIVSSKDGVRSVEDGHQVQDRDEGQDDVFRIERVDDEAGQLKSSVNQEEDDRRIFARSLGVEEGHDHEG